MKLDPDLLGTKTRMILIRYAKNQDVEKQYKIKSYQAYKQEDTR